MSHCSGIRLVGQKFRCAGNNGEIRELFDVVTVPRAVIVDAGHQLRQREVIDAVVKKRRLVVPFANCCPERDSIVNELLICVDNLVRFGLAPSIGSAQRSPALWLHL
jgi:hypothetical protein